MYVIQPMQLRKWLGILLVSITAGCTLLNQTEELQCSSNRDCTQRGGPFSNSICGSQGVCIALQLNSGGEGGGSGAAGAGGALPDSCETNQDCIAKVGGQVLCKQSKCVSATSPQCTRVLGSVADNPDFILGVMSPLKGSQALEGTAYVNSIEVGFNEFRSRSQNGVLGLRNPLMIICDELDAPEDAARHLNEVGARVVLGPIRTANIERTIPIFRSSSTIALFPVHDDPSLEEITEQKELFWGCKPNRANIATVWTSVMEQVELHIKEREPSMSSLRVALVSAGDSSSQSLTLKLTGNTSFNGKTEEANKTDGNFFRVTYGNEQTEQIAYTALASQIAENETGKQPNLVILISSAGGAQNLVPALESIWPTGAGAPERPYYLVIGDAGGIEPTILFPKAPDLSSRYLALGWNATEQTTKNMQSFRNAYQALFSGQTPRVDSEYAYDCFWLGLYGGYAALAKEKQSFSSLNGALFSNGVGILNSPGQPENVGILGVTNMLSILSAGGDPDLNGASSSLDFDLNRRTPAANPQLSCISNNKLTPSGLFFDVKTGLSNGTNGCPK
jgi:hypothetical protein